MARKSPMLKELKVAIREKLIGQKKISMEQCDWAAQVAVDTLREIYGGDQPYIPKDDSRLDARDWDIWDRFNGNNQAELAKRYNLSERQIYNILEKVRPIAMAREQRSLFDVEEPDCING
jgi:Mor family transcriptional regulator